MDMDTLGAGYNYIASNMVLYYNATKLLHTCMCFVFINICDFTIFYSWKVANINYVLHDKYASCVI